MRNMLFLIAGIPIMLTVATFGQTADSRPLKTIESLDLGRYQGTWYEIAKYPNRFQKRCARNTTARYALKSNDRVEVVNHCQAADGKAISANGEAKVVDGANNSKLKVRFAPEFLSFLPFVWGDYCVIDLDAGYTYAVIGDPDRKYFWILSRTPTMDNATYEAILQRASMQGYDPLKVEKTPQS